MPVTLYGMEGSAPCRSVMLTAKAIGLPIQLKNVNLQTGEHKTPEFLKMNPAHTIPTLDDNGFYLHESYAIATYLIDTYAKNDKLYPKDTKQRAIIDSMLHFDNGTFYCAIGRYYYPQLLFKKPADPMAEQNMKDRFEVLNNILGLHPYVAGNAITVADLCIINSLTVAEAAKFKVDTYPNVAKWAAKVRKELTFYDEVTKAGVDQLTQFFSGALK